MTYLSAFILGMVAVEIFLRLSIIGPAKDVLASSGNSLEIIQSSELPDEEKQRLLLKNSRETFISTSRLAIKLIILALGVVGVFWLMTILFSLEIGLIKEVSFLITTTISSIIYGVARNRFV